MWSFGFGVLAGGFRLRVQGLGFSEGLGFRVEGWDLPRAG